MPDRPALALIDSADERPTAPTLAGRYTVIPEEAAQMLGVSRETVLRRIRAGKLHASKVTPSVIRIRVADIEAHLAHHAA